MMMNRILSLLLLAFAHSECTVFDRPLLILPSSYENLNVSDPSSIRIFHKGLRSVGIEPSNGLTLQTLGLKRTVIVSHFLAQYRTSSGFECWFRFSSWLISGLRGRLPTCVNTGTDAPTEQPTTTLPPRTTSTTEDSKSTKQNESISTAEGSMDRTAEDSVDSTAEDSVDSTAEDSVDSTAEDSMHSNSISSVVKPEETKVVEEVKKEEKLIVSKKVDKSAGVSNTKKPKGTTYPKKNQKLQDEVGTLVSAASQKVLGSVQDLLGQDSAPRTSKVSNPVEVPSGASQTKVPASLSGNLEVDTWKSTKRSVVSIPAKKRTVGDTVVKLCFDGALFVKNGGKWIPSAEGC